MAELADIVKIINRPLFSLRFLHAGFGLPRPGNISDSMRLDPDEATQKIFNNYHIGYRFLNDMLVVFIRCSNPVPTTPLLKLSGAIRLRFYLQVSTEFLNKTEVQSVGATQLYHFSNRENIGTGGFISRHTEGVNDDDLELVVMAEAEETCFGVIDVYNTGAVNTSYDLFSGAEQTLNSPGYSIRFISKI